MEVSHLVGSIAGVALLILARGLMRRFHVAWVATELLLAAGVVVSLAKGIDYEEAAIMAIVAAILLPFRSSFYRMSGFSELRLSPAWFAMVLAGVVAATWLGFFSYRHVEYSNQLWWQFEWNGNAPRFLRATVAVCAVLVWAAVAFLIHRPPAVRFRPDPVSDVVRRLVAAAPHTQPNVALLGDKKFLIAEDESAFLMYGRSGRSWISMGDPVGGGPAAVELIWRLRELADRNGGRTIYYAVSQAYLPTFLDMGLSILKIGEIARVDLPAFSLEGKKRQDFRYADRRATKEGLAFEVIPKADVPSRIEELKAVSDAWLAQKSGHEKGFSLGFFSPPYLAEFDCAVLKDANGIQAFANLWRSGGREEMSVDIMRYRPQRSPILMDALFARLLLYAKGEGYRWFNLGAAPLAGLKQHPLASNWNKLGTLLYRHAEDFYHFEGLKAFKQKFDPVWVPQYIAGPRRARTARRPPRRHQPRLRGQARSARQMNFSVLSFIGALAVYALSALTPSFADVDPPEIVDLPSERQSRALAVIYSGDGGWQDLDKTIGEWMAGQDIHVVGVSTLETFWDSREPETVAADLEKILADADPTGTLPVLVVGYSFGADVFPFAWPHLRPATQDRIRLVALLAPERETAFHVSVVGWLGVETGKPSRAARHCGAAARARALRLRQRRAGQHPVHGRFHRRHRDRADLRRSPFRWRL